MVTTSNIFVFFAFLQPNWFLFSASGLPSVMASDKLKSLPEIVHSSVLVVGIALFVFMEYDALPIINIFDIPTMTSATTLKRDIVLISREDIEILRIDCL